MNMTDEIKVPVLNNLIKIEIFDLSMLVHFQFYSNS